MNERDMAILLVEGELAKAKALKEWLDSPRPTTESSIVLWRMYFAHLAAAERYMAISKRSTE